jgi:hypothetical protein
MIRNALAYSRKKSPHEKSSFLRKTCNGSFKTWIVTVWIQITRSNTKPRIPSTRVTFPQSRHISSIISNAAIAQLSGKSDRISILPDWTNKYISILNQKIFFGNNQQQIPWIGALRDWQSTCLNRALFVLLCVSLFSRLFWVSSLAYPNLLETVSEPCCLVLFLSLYVSLCFLVSFGFHL